ncbi:hypothetical protein PVAND_004054 [Polypedilum vanderplanki]|uniref:Uncharacterized protein n=1 Tax=Polypedilum vanderplanki TaxID=319348 RepID=A0A9J6BWG2_POLVA|nr:hypothetical protein PVAND_004054 [Polypedilum vanderplanki]
MEIRVEEYLQELRYGWYNEDESIECLKKKIKETEPYASIAMADDEKSVNLENCYVEPQLEWSHDLFNEKASPFPCFVKSRNAVNFDNFFYKLRILEFGNLNDEIRKIEIENIGKLLKKMSEMNYKCLIKYID